MLHEILLALLGYTGDLIVDERECRDSLGILSPDSPVADIPSFKLAPDLSFIAPSDRDVIERIISLGFYYRELDRFATKSRNLSWIRSASANVSPLERSEEISKRKSENQSVYRRAIANAIVEILSVYRSAVLQIEQKLLADALPILATVTQGLNKFFVLLPPLYELILEIERDDVRGGKLLNLLHKRCHCGVPELQTCLQRLLWHGHQVLFNQLASWMVYGILQDPYGEFFIKSEEGRELGKDSSNPDMIRKLTRLTIEDSSLADWHLGFHISLDMLPEYIHMRVAESVLFAGKAVRVLRNPSPGFAQDSLYHPKIPRESYIIQGFADRFSFQKDSSSDSELTGEELLPQAEADKIEAMLQDLKESTEFHKRSFEYAVDSIRAIAASHLWQLVVVRADLNGHLKALKDYFLLAKGDFFQCFLEESRQLMRLPPRQSTAEADLMVPFQLAAVKTISDEDKYFSRVSLRMPSIGVAVKSTQADAKSKSYSSGTSSAASTNTTADVDGWDGITLEYSIDWPLQLFFTQEVLSKYCRVFQYLLRLKRTQMELEKSWASVMHQDHSDFAKHRNERIKCPTSQQRRQRFRPMWRVREHMAFLIRNLQFYIQVDVIESQWNILQTHIQDSRDFTELVNFHQEYMSALISQSFLDIGSVSRILDSIMKLCLQYCWCIENQESPNTAELDHITEEFNKKSNSLYTILRSSRLAGSQRAPFLRRFLLRLNFNSFFEATARGVLNVVRPRPSLPVLQQ
ncbi:gamma-tubulin complex component 4-like [Chenopodium quinoa]|uniref:gamma-tubulin complex component 4-like n=1 Tax=Chenopodium quinoa TaxID=63459 RepID=UPI000B7835CD|nr:gamma-tubulin complex component 4-like [Chenopodium quinoa]